MECIPPDSPTFDLEDGMEIEAGKEDTISMQSTQSAQVSYTAMGESFQDKSLIQYFVADFPYKVSLKMLN